MNTALLEKGHSSLISNTIHPQQSDSATPIRFGSGTSKQMAIVFGFGSTNRIQKWHVRAIGNRLQIRQHQLDSEAARQSNRQSTSDSATPIGFGSSTSKQSACEMDSNAKN
jgi:hypothetical protein